MTWAIQHSMSPQQPEKCIFPLYFVPLSSFVWLVHDRKQNSSHFSVLVCPYTPSSGASGSQDQWLPALQNRHAAFREAPRKPKPLVFLPSAQPSHTLTTATMKRKRNSISENWVRLWQTPCVLTSPALAMMKPVCLPMSKIYCLVYISHNLASTGRRAFTSYKKEGLCWLRAVRTSKCL